MIARYLGTRGKSETRDQIQRWDVSLGYKVFDREIDTEPTTLMIMPVECIVAHRHDTSVEAGYCGQSQPKMPAVSRA